MSDDLGKELRVDYLILVLIVAVMCVVFKIEGENRDCCIEGKWKSSLAEYEFCDESRLVVRVGKDVIEGKYEQDRDAKKLVLNYREGECEVKEEYTYYISHDVLSLDGNIDHVLIKDK